MSNKSMTILRHILFISLIGFWLQPLIAQDPVMSHFISNGIQIDPSIAGIEGPARFYMGYRNQWPNTSSTFITYQAAYDQYIEKLHGGLGFHVMNDRQGGGIFNTYNLDLMYAYQFMANRKIHFSGALQAGIGQRSFDPFYLELGDMIDPVTGGLSGLTENIDGYSVFYPDFAVGFSGYYDIFNGGAAIHHLLTPYVTDTKDESERIARTYTLHFGALIPVKERRRGREIIQLYPQIIYMQQLNKQQFIYGIDMYYSGFIFGLKTRHDLVFNYGDLIFNLGYYTDKIRFRYSYDTKLTHPSNRLKNLGAHELSLLIIYEKHSRRNRQRTIKYPKI
ncbi:PorP/SprF family type IX secretion system membrane protein [Bacteroidota bacterium]